MVLHKFSEQQLVSPGVPQVVEVVPARGSKKGRLEGVEPSEAHEQGARSAARSPRPDRSDVCGRASRRLCNYGLRLGARSQMGCREA